MLKVTGQKKNTVHNKCRYQLTIVTDNCFPVSSSHVGQSTRLAPFASESNSTPNKLTLGCYFSLNGYMYFCFLLRAYYNNILEKDHWTRFDSIKQQQVVIQCTSDSQHVLNLRLLKLDVQFLIVAPKKNVPVFMHA